MARKILNKTSPGDGTTFGADDVDYINSLLTGVDQGGTDPVDINTQWTYRSSKLRQANPANTFYYTVVGSAIAADRNLTLPLLTGNDTAVTEAHAQTLTNKTIAAASNTLTGVVTPTSTDTLTNKTMAFGSNTFTGFVTPTSTDTFTNKTMSYSNNTFTNFPIGMPYPDTKRMGGWFGGVLTAGATISSGWLIGMFSGYVAATTTGTASYFSDAAGKYTRQTSGAVSGNDAGFNVNTDATTNPIMAVTGQNNPRLKVKFRTSTETLCRVAIGFTGTTGAFLLSAADAPGTGVAHVAWIMPSAGNYIYSHNDTSGPAIADTTGVVRNANANVLELKTTDGGTTWLWDFNGTTGSASANVPTNTTALYPHFQIETNAAVAKTLDTWYWFVETDIG